MAVTRKNENKDIEDIDEIFWNIENNYIINNDNDNNNNLKYSNSLEINENYLISCYSFENIIKKEKYILGCKGIEIKLKESYNNGVFETIGKEIWEGSLILCCIILKNIKKFCFSNVLELGSGIGLPSFLLLILKQRYLFFNSNDNLGEVILTDFDDEILLNLNETLKEQFSEELFENKINLSSFNFNVHINKLDWNQFLNLEHPPLDNNFLQENKNSQILFGSELIYTHLQEGLLHLIIHYIENCNCEDIIIVQISSRPGFQEFLSHLEQISLLKRFNYSIDNVSKSLYQSAQQIKKIISPINNNEKIWISHDLINSLIPDDISEIIQTNLSHEQTNNCLIDQNIQLKDILLTEKENYSILRIWRNEVLESDINI